jgi:hypothetical protein
MGRVGVGGGGGGEEESEVDRDIRYSVNGGVCR